MDALQLIWNSDQPQMYTPPEIKGQSISMVSSGYYQGFNEIELINFAAEKKGIVHFYILQENIF